MRNNGTEWHRSTVSACAAIECATNSLIHEKVSNAERTVLSLSAQRKTQSETKRDNERLELDDFWTFLSIRFRMSREQTNLLQIIFELRYLTSTLSYRFHMNALYDERKKIAFFFLFRFYFC